MIHAAAAGDSAFAMPRLMAQLEGLSEELGDRSGSQVRRPFIRMRSCW